MNKQGISRISVVFFSIVFIILWALFFGSQLSAWGNVAIANGGYTGIEALLWGNLNIIVGFIFIVFVLAVGSVAE
jgi:hypothetical protein